ncbi:MAG: metal ABC transporter ATP-binding protein [Thermoplasmatales archaeon]|nr:MAG: metal ABC transporter ATP-binding protein [Thermoplasmatales archaeon]
MNNNMNAIELRNIETIYEGERIPVIHDVNLTVKVGEFLAIIGPNGAGKTTLLETINGLLPYTDGQGFVFEKEIAISKTAIRKEIGYVIQNFELDPLAPFLCKDVVMSGRSGKIGLFRFPFKKDWEIVWHSMGLVGMIDFANRPIGKLSGGEFQKILLARALAQKPKLLLLDEPFSNLDLSARRQIETLLNRLHGQRKITIVIVSHDLSFIPSRCSRVIILDKGRIVMDGEKEKILTSSIIDTIFHEKRGGE